MQPSLLEILACPVCKGKLALEGAGEKGREIVTGSLRCARCNIIYSIKNGIPELLPPEKNQ